MAALILEGLTREEIAERLSIGIKTVEAHSTRISERMGLRPYTSIRAALLEERVVALEAENAKLRQRVF